ncbi:MAG: hypothetical protein N3A69_17210, partial [Leptospiraceae bacterium]|nr:hypothetical protein [Leptospiraceae bacterium]
FVFSLGTDPMMFGVNFFSQTIKKFLGKSKFGYFLGATLLAFAVYSIYSRIHLNDSENCHTPSSP